MAIVVVGLLVAILIVLARIYGELRIMNREPRKAVIVPQVTKGAHSERITYKEGAHGIKTLAPQILNPRLTHSEISRDLEEKDSKRAQKEAAHAR